jgi:hypothetical protein
MLHQIANLIEATSVPQDAIPSGDLVRQSQFPDCAVGKVVRIQNVVERVTEVVDNGKRFHLMDFHSGKTKTYEVSLVVKKLPYVFTSPEEAVEAGVL